jgi:hypothetical protein
MAQIENGGSSTSVHAIVRRPVKVSRDGIPVDSQDWTAQDWSDLHKAIEKAKKAIAKRHKNGK